jgi:hypothetical protein
VVVLNEEAEEGDRKTSQFSLDLVDRGFLANALRLIFIDVVFVEVESWLVLIVNRFPSAKGNSNA